MTKSPNISPINSPIFNLLRRLNRGKHKTKGAFGGQSKIMRVKKLHERNTKEIEIEKKTAAVEEVKNTVCFPENKNLDAWVIWLPIAKEAICSVPPMG